MTEKPFRIVFLDAATFGDVSLKNYSALGECAFYETSTSEEVLARLRGAHAVVINKVVMDRSVLTASEAEELKLVAIAATGTDHVDLAVAKERGITVCNVPGYATEAVAQFTMALLLELVNNVGRYASLVRSGAWQKSRIFTLLDFPSFELAGKKLGIIGYGSIGQAVARIAQGFGMEILISVSPGVDGPVPAGRVPFNHLLTTADVVTLHCPLTEATRSLLNQQSFALMKPGAFLINTARGGLVDEPSLVQALKAKRLAGAAVDVLSEEPPTENQFLIKASGELDNLIVTPHCAWTPKETRQRLMVEVEKNIRAFQRGEKRNSVT